MKFINNLIIVFIVIFSLVGYVDYLSADTYYDYEKIEVDILPNASEETKNKVYIVDNLYYVTNVINSGYEALPLNEELKGKIIYFDYKSLSYSTILNFNLRDGNIANLDCLSSTYCSFSIFKNNKGNIQLNHYSIYVPTLSSSFGQKSMVFKEDGTYKDEFDSFIYNSSYKIKEWIYPVFSQYFSLTPFSITYEWKQVAKDEVYEYKLPKEDFYLFYKFDDISNFNILSDFNLNILSDYEKIVIVLLFNLFYLGFIGLCIYIIVRILYKGLSLLF